MKKEIDFFDEAGKFIFTSKYARYDKKHQRRETWHEAVKRVEKMHLKKYSYLAEEDLKKIIWAFDLVRDKRIVPSMRSIQFGGKPIEAHNTRMFNCSVRHIDSIRSFSEIFFLLMCGSGVGFGLNKDFLDRLPDLVDKNDRTGTIITYVVEDSIEGWADSVEALLSCYFKNNAYTGRKIVFDFSKIRPKGSPIKIGGGKVLGHEGLKQSLRRIKELLDYLIEVKGQKQLTSINAYDIVMHVADAVLSGGIRRSATIALFMKNDDLMLNSKTNFKVIRKLGFENISKEGDAPLWEGRVIIDTTYGGFEKKKYDVVLSDYEYNEMLCKQGVINWIHILPHRARSNNSVLLMRNEITKEYFKHVVERIQQYGEPGFVFADNPYFLVNPCAEVGFIPVTNDGICGVQFCNLVSENGKFITTEKEFEECTVAATLLGTLQAGYTDYNYLNKTSTRLTEEESLLGVSITGMMENPDILLNPEIQTRMAKLAIEVNKEWSEKIGIKQAARITLVKPEGTTSLLLGTSSGIHPHHSRNYFRRVQCNKEDNVYRHFKKYNEHATEPSVWSATNTDDVITFPFTISNEAFIKENFTAIQHLKYILSTQKHWVLDGESEENHKKIHHNVSCTVVVDTNEWDDVIDYIYNNKEYFTAVSFIAKCGDKIFPQTPNEDIVSEEDKSKFNGLKNNWNIVEYNKMVEDEDGTMLQKEVACSGGACEIIYV
jgi:ribonucleoside-triphosphate reductase (thioredoxin)